MPKLYSVLLKNFTLTKVKPPLTDSVKMTTNLMYFRPKNHQIPSPMPIDVDVNDTFTYEIMNKSMRTCTQIAVPNNLTVFYHDQGSSPSEHGVPKSSGSGGKICVFLVGSDQCPDNILTSSPVDRIQFHGSIGYEKPVFEMIRRLPGVKKVKFFLGYKQLANFVEWEDTTDWVNGSVTSLTIIVEKVPSSKTVDNKGGNRQDQLKIIFEKIIIRILHRAATRFPSLRKLTMEVPSSKKVQNAVGGLIDKLRHLKATLVQCDETCDRLTVGKLTSPQSSSSSSQNIEDTVHPTSLETPVPEKVALTDLGKLLESMLGIGMMGIKPTISESKSAMLPEVKLIHQEEESVPTKLSVDVPKDIDEDKVNLTKTIVRNSGKAVTIVEPEEQPLEVMEQFPESQEEDHQNIDDRDPCNDCHNQDNEIKDEEDGFQESEIVNETKQCLQPMFHHPLCHDYHQYLGVPIIPGFGIGVYHYPLQQSDNTDTSNAFENQAVADKGR